MRKLKKKEERRFHRPTRSIKDKYDHDLGPMPQPKVKGIANVLSFFILLFWV